MGVRAHSKNAAIKITGVQRYEWMRALVQIVLIVHVHFSKHKRNRFQLRDGNIRFFQNAPLLVESVPIFQDAVKTVLAMYSYMTATLAQEKIQNSNTNITSKNAQGRKRIPA